MLKKEPDVKDKSAWIGWFWANTKNQFSLEEVEKLHSMRLAGQLWDGALKQAFGDVSHLTGLNEKVE